MDKVKHYLELVRKHHFWVLCAIAVVAGGLAWYISSGKLAAEFKTNSGTIESTLTSLQGGVAADQPHDDWTEGMNKETQAAAQDVLNAWKALYDEQKEKVFVWPKELSQDFLDAANQLSDPNAVIPRKLREYYQSMVKQQVGRLADIVDAASLDEMAGNKTALDHSVDWSQTSQQDIEQTFDWTERPSTLLIKYAQEELWVYQALCNVIKAANEGATGRHDAVIQEIDAMEIAYEAVEDAPGGAGQNRVEPLVATAASPSAPPAPGAPGAGAGNNRPDPKARGKGQGQSRGFAFGPGAGDAAAAAPTNPDDLLKSYRYVNLDGTPKSAGDVDAAGGEYNLMPFRLLLKMDSRYVDKLLVAFRNSVLPFEVQQVRINPESTAGGGGGGGGRFSRPGPMGPPTGPAGPPMGPSAPSRNSSGEVSASHDRMVTVEVRGVAYLIKPPDLQKLHLVVPAADAAAGDAAAPAGAGQVEAAAVGGVIKQIGDQSAAAPAGNAGAAGGGAPSGTTPPAAAAPESAPPGGAPAQQPAP